MRIGQVTGAEGAPITWSTLLFPALGEQEVVLQLGSQAAGVGLRQWHLRDTVDADPVGAPAIACPCKRPRRSLLWCGICRGHACECPGHRPALHRPASALRQLMYTDEMVLFHPVTMLGDCANAAVLPG